jgi:signal transduction histidine kinase
MLVEDTGPGIPSHDYEVIFERGFTRKPAGQGLGLYISQAILGKEGYSLSTRESQTGASFVIAPELQIEDTEGDAMDGLLS